MRSKPHSPREASHRHARALFLSLADWTHINWVEQQSINSDNRRNNGDHIRPGNLRGPGRQSSDDSQVSDEIYLGNAKVVAPEDSKDFILLLKSLLIILESIYFWETQHTAPLTFDYPHLPREHQPRGRVKENNDYNPWTSFYKYLSSHLATMALIWEQMYPRAQTHHAHVLANHKYIGRQAVLRAIESNKRSSSAAQAPAAGFSAAQRRPRPRDSRYPEHHHQWTSPNKRATDIPMGSRKDPMTYNPAKGQKPGSLTPSPLKRLMSFIYPRSPSPTMVSSSDDEYDEAGEEESPTLREMINHLEDQLSISTTNKPFPAETGLQLSLFADQQGAKLGSPKTSPRRITPLVQDKPLPRPPSKEVQGSLHHARSSSSTFSIPSSPDFGRPRLRVTNPSRGSTEDSLRSLSISRSDIQQPLHQAHSSSYSLGRSSPPLDYGPKLKVTGPSRHGTEESFRSFSSSYSDRKGPLHHIRSSSDSFSRSSSSLDHDPPILRVTNPSWHGTEDSLRSSSASRSESSTSMSSILYMASKSKHTINGREPPSISKLERHTPSPDTYKSPSVSSNPKRNVILSITDLEPEEEKPKKPPTPPPPRVPSPRSRPTILKPKKAFLTITDLDTDTSEAKTTNEDHDIVSPLHSPASTSGTVLYSERTPKMPDRSHQGSPKASLARVHSSDKRWEINPKKSSVLFRLHDTEDDLLSFAPKAVEKRPDVPVKATHSRSTGEGAKKSKEIQVKEKVIWSVEDE
ncbi:hypothetical protein FRC03_010125 [Tulasnella sp. 419]|nr:hypothetical protein FRC03_010125 [Tulasnella sp. 419]